MIVTTLGAMHGMPLGICDDTVLGSLEWFIYGAAVGKFEGLLLRA